MKVVLLNASPRPQSNIRQMLSVMQEELQVHGAEVDFIDVCKLQVRPCIGCMKCRSSHNCVLPEDDAQRVLRLIQECDALVVGSPCYWGNMTGAVKDSF